MKSTLSFADDVVGAVLLVVGLALCAVPFVQGPAAPAVATAIVTPAMPVARARPLSVAAQTSDAETASDASRTCDERAQQELVRLQALCRG